MSRHTRATTVVSHPRRLSTPLTSVRLNRIQASWTASSASLTDPSMRYATARTCARCSSNCSASRSGVGIGHIPPSRSVIVLTDGTIADVTGPRHEEDGLKIKLTSIYVDDQDKALRFYTEVLGFAKKADFRTAHFAG